MKPGNRLNAMVPIPAGDILRDEEGYRISSLKRFFILNPSIHIT
jgi:hypothetical protein